MCRTPTRRSNPDSPVCSSRSALAYYLGRVTFELKADTHPVTSENFLKLCEFKCYAATKFKVFPGTGSAVGFTDLDGVVWRRERSRRIRAPCRAGRADRASTSPAGPTSRTGLRHHRDGPGFDPQSGRARLQRQQFMIRSPASARTARRTHVAFGQVLEGGVLAARAAGRRAAGEDTFQRVTEQCGVLRARGGAASAGPTAAGWGCRGERARDERGRFASGDAAAGGAIRSVAASRVRGVRMCVCDAKPAYDRTHAEPSRRASFVRRVLSSSICVSRPRLRVPPARPASRRRSFPARREARG